jgi:hypothetical protein
VNEGTIAANCKAAGGLIKVELEALRNELGYKKLGKWVLSEIAETLRTSGLGYFPEWVLDPVQNTEMRRWQEVWIYARDGSTRAKVIDAVLRPDESDVRGVLDGLAGGDLNALTAEQRLARIVEIATA